jgi:hypothetical protein
VNQNGEVTRGGIDTRPGEGTSVKVFLPRSSQTAADEQGVQAVAAAAGSRNAAAVRARARIFRTNPQILAQA